MLQPADPLQQVPNFNARATEVGNYMQQDTGLIGQHAVGDGRGETAAGRERLAEGRKEIVNAPTGLTF